MTRGIVPLAILAGVSVTLKNQKISNLGARETPKNKEIKFLGAVGESSPDLCVNYFR